MQEDKAYALKWVCLICGNAYDTEDEARRCSLSHEELKITPKYVIGERMPKYLIVEHVRGNKVIEKAIYVQTSTEEIDER